MADSKISALSSATALSGGEFFSVVQSGSNVKATATQILGFITTQNYLQFGPTSYPVSSYPASSNAYFVIDKSGTASDSSIVLRDQGKARAEIGCVGDNNLHFKTVTGNYGSEVFTDAMIMYNNASKIDTFPGIFRINKASGTPTFIAGNSDGSSSGAGLELQYDQTNTQSNITSIERGNTYRAMNFYGNGFYFNSGGGSTSLVATIDANGVKAVNVPSAYVNVTGNTGARVVNQSFNVSSVTDTGTGIIVVNFTNSFSDTHYVANVTVQMIGTTYSVANIRTGRIYSAAQLTGSCKLLCLTDTANTHVVADPTSWHFIAIGT